MVLMVDSGIERRGVIERTSKLAKSRDGGDREERVGEGGEGGEGEKGRGVEGERVRGGRGGGASCVAG